jgi:hypothetical protein
MRTYLHPSQLPPENFDFSVPVYFYKRDRIDHAVYLLGYFLFRAHEMTATVNEEKPLERVRLEAVPLSSPGMVISHDLRSADWR